MSAPGIVISGLMFGLFSAVTAYGAEQPCPEPGAGEVFPFDGTKVTFDSIQQQTTATEKSVVNCVLIANAKHEYHVDWSEAGINAFTEKGFLRSTRHLGDIPELDKSIAYIGVNRTKFTPGLETEKTIIAKLREAFESRFLGSVSLVGNNQPEPVREGKLLTVNLRFVAELSEPGRARLEYSDEAAQALNIGFSLPDDVQKTIPDRELLHRLSRDPSSFEYSVGPGEPVAVTVPIVLKNSDFQPIGTIPVIIIMPSSK